jgi:hypothetical protein
VPPRVQYNVATTNRYRLLQEEHDGEGQPARPPQADGAHPAPPHAGRTSRRRSPACAHRHSHASQRRSQSRDRTVSSTDGSGNSVCGDAGGRPRAGSLTRGTGSAAPNADGQERCVVAAPLCGLRRGFLDSGPFRGGVAAALAEAASRGAIESHAAKCPGPLPRLSAAKVAAATRPTLAPTEAPEALEARLWRTGSGGQRPLLSATTSARRGPVVPLAYPSPPRCRLSPPRLSLEEMPWRRGPARQGRRRAVRTVRRRRGSGGRPRLLQLLLRRRMPLRRLVPLPRLPPPLRRCRRTQQACVRRYRRSPQLVPWKGSRLMWWWPPSQPSAR